MKQEEREGQLIENSTVITFSDNESYRQLATRAGEYILDRRVDKFYINVSAQIEEENDGTWRWYRSQVESARDYRSVEEFVDQAMGTVEAAEGYDRPWLLPVSEIQGKAIQITVW